MNALVQTHNIAFLSKEPLNGVIKAWGKIATHIGIRTALKKSNNDFIRQFGTSVEIKLSEEHGVLFMRTAYGRVMIHIRPHETKQKTRVYLTGVASMVMTVCQNLDNLNFFETNTCFVVANDEDEFKRMVSEAPKMFCA